MRLTIHRGGAAGDVDVPLDKLVALDLAALACAWKIDGHTFRSVGVPLTLETEESSIISPD